MKTLERQYLIEAETKLEAMQVRLDQYFGVWPITRSMEEDYWRLFDYVQQLKKYLGDHGHAT